MFIGTLCGKTLISAIVSHGRKVQPLFPELFDLLLPTSQILTAGVPHNVRNLWPRYSHSTHKKITCFKVTT